MLWILLLEARPPEIGLTYYLAPLLLQTLLFLSNLPLYSNVNTTIISLEFILAVDHALQIPLRLGPYPPCA